MDDASVKRRRPFRFSLRTLLIAMTVLCIWLGLKVSAAHRQREAVTAILKAGGELCFDYQWVPNPSGKPGSLQWDGNAELPEPAWLRTLVGNDYFRDVTNVDFYDCGVSESDFGQLAKCRAFKR